MANDPTMGLLIAVALLVLVFGIVIHAVDACRKDRILEEFCAECGGVFIGGGEAAVRHRSWSITVSMETESSNTGHADPEGTSTTTTTTREYTRVRAPYFPTDDFHFSIYPKGCFSGLGVFFGMQDVNLGDPSFDNLFVVQGSDEAKLHELLENPAIRELLRREPAVSLARKADDSWFFRKLPKGMDELYLEVEETVLDVGRLKSLTLLAGEVLDELVSIGSASEGGSSSEFGRSQEIVFW